MLITMFLDLWIDSKWLLFHRKTGLHINNIAPSIKSESFPSFWRSLSTLWCDGCHQIFVPARLIFVVCEKEVTGHIERFWNAGLWKMKKANRETTFHSCSLGTTTNNRPIPFNNQQGHYLWLHNTNSKVVDQVSFAKNNDSLEVANAHKNRCRKCISRDGESWLCDWSQIAAEHRLTYRLDAAGLAQLVRAWV